MLERIKEHHQDTRLARTQSSAVSEQSILTGHYPLWDEVKFIDRDPYWYTRRVNEAIHIRLHSENINRYSGIEISEARMPTMKQYNTNSVPMRTTEGTISSLNDKDRNPLINNRSSEDRNAPIIAKHGATYAETACRHHRLMKTSSIAVEMSRSMIPLWHNCKRNDQLSYHYVTTISDTFHDIF